MPGKRKLREPEPAFKKPVSGEAEASATRKWVAFVSNSAWYIFIHRYDVICFLLKNGYSILVVAPEDQPVPAFAQAGILFLPYQFSNKSRNPLSALRLYRHLVGMYRQYRPVCVFHYAIKANIFGSFAARRAGVPCVSVINGIGHGFARRNLLFRLIRSLYRKALSIPAAVWVLNEEDGRFFTEHRMVAPAKLHNLNGEGINTAHFSLQAIAGQPVPEFPGFTFIIITRWLYSKGIGTLAEAATLLKKAGLSFTCLLVGMPDEGHPDGIPAEQMTRWQEAGWLTVHPFTTEVRPLLAAADCFVLPSYYNEGMPRCLMEAASMQLPIITTDRKGCRETILPGISGLFCEAKNPTHLAGQMRAIMQLPPPQRAAMGLKGREWMQKQFAIERICQVYLQAVQAVG